MQPNSGAREVIPALGIVNWIWFPSMESINSSAFAKVILCMAVGDSNGLFMLPFGSYIKDKNRK